GWVSDRLASMYGPGRGRRIVPIIGLTLSSILLSVGLNLTEPGAAAALMCLSLAFASSADGSYWASAISVGGEHVGAACGILNSGGNVGGFLAPVVTAYIASRVGWSWALYAGAFMVMCGVVSWFFIGSESSVRKE